MTGGAWPLDETEVDLAPGQHFNNVGAVAHFERDAHLWPCRGEAPQPCRDQVLGNGEAGAQAQVRALVIAQRLGPGQQLGYRMQDRTGPLDGR